MAITEKKEITRADLICLTGHYHIWDYVRASSGQEAIYKCTQCFLVVSKAHLKELTDGGY
jgi:hypothetical protein